MNERNTLAPVYAEQNHFLINAALATLLRRTPRSPGQLTSVSSSRQVVHSLVPCFDLKPGVSSRNRSSLLEQFLQLLSIVAGEIRVATNVLLANEDVGDRLLTRHVEQGLLNIFAVVLLVQFVMLVLGIQAIKNPLAVPAVWTPRLAKDHYSRKGCPVSGSTDDENEQTEILDLREERYILTALSSMSCCAFF